MHVTMIFNRMACSEVENEYIYMNIVYACIYTQKKIISNSLHIINFDLIKKSSIIKIITCTLY